MTGILEKLFNGELNPEDRNPSRSPRYLEQMGLMSDADERLRETLTPQQEELFDDFLYQALLTQTHEQTDSFVYGFRLGMLMTLDAHSVSDKYMI